MKMEEDYRFMFTQDDVTVIQNLGYPKAYAKLCRDRGVSPYSHGPPFTFTPYYLQQDEASRAKDLDELFAIIDPKAKPTSEPKIFISLLWRKLNHLGDAGFDPEMIRVDPYGNVLYFRADSASPLAWDIDHWFPCSRGGLTVSSNLRILQWQACKKKHNKLEFLIPWWEFQVGISVNQFLSIFASSNSDFRHRAFSFLFSEGENEELNATQIVDSHSFPQHFVELKDQVGLAPAAIVKSKRDSLDKSSALKELDCTRKGGRPQYPAIVAASKIKPSILKENENPNWVSNPHQAIVLARDSLKQKEVTAKVQEEIQELDDEVKEMKLRNEEEKLVIQDLEMALTKRKRRAEKYRRLAESQSSYRSILEKMIRDTMHQSVMYKEQLRLNQAAAHALMARLEAQRAICDAAEQELYIKYKERDELEKRVHPDHARKRSRVDDSSYEETDNRTMLRLPAARPKTPLHKELRVYLEEEQRASESNLSPNEEVVEDRHRKPAHESDRKGLKEQNKISLEIGDEEDIGNKLQKLELTEENKPGLRFPIPKQPEIEDDEESRKQRGKGNVEKWLQMLLENSHEELEPQEANENRASRTDEMIRILNMKYPLQEGKVLKNSEPQRKDKQQQLAEEKYSEIDEENIVSDACENIKQKRHVSMGEASFTEERSGKSFGGLEKRAENRKEKKLFRSESAKTLRRIPSSPLLTGMRKGVDWIRKKQR